MEYAEYVSCSDVILGRNPGSRIVEKFKSVFLTIIYSFFDRFV